MIPLHPNHCSSIPPMSQLMSKLNRSTTTNKVMAQTEKGTWKWVVTSNVTAWLVY